MKPLSPRETQVMELAAQGKTHKQIARMLRISHHTVKIHAEHIREKMEVHSMSQALVMWGRMIFLKEQGEAA